MILSSRLISILSATFGFVRREESSEEDINEEDIPPCMYGPPPSRYEVKDLVDNVTKKIF